MIFIAYPWAALLPAAFCAFLWLRRNRRVAALATIAWVLYAVYELLMKARVLCSGECNIRVDLLLIYPLLGALTLASVITGLRKAGPASRPAA